MGRAEVTSREIADFASVAAEILERGVSPSIVFTNPFSLNFPSLVKGRGQWDRLLANII